MNSVVGEECVNGMIALVVPEIERSPCSISAGGQQ